MKSRDIIPNYKMYIIHELFTIDESIHPKGYLDPSQFIRPNTFLCLYIPL